MTLVVVARANARGFDSCPHAPVSSPAARVKVRRKREVMNPPPGVEMKPLPKCYVFSIDYVLMQTNKNRPGYIQRMAFRAAALHIP